MAMKNKQYIIFDLDGTLIDSFETIIKACKKVMANYSFKQSLNDEFFAGYRYGDIEQMFNELAVMADLSKEKFREQYDEQYKKDCIAGSSIIDKQFNVLKEAKANGIGIIILTNKKQDIAEEVCKKMFGSNMIDIVIGRKDTQPIKPRHVIKNRLQEYGINPQEQCMKYYGDSKSDYETAKFIDVEYININVK